MVQPLFQNVRQFLKEVKTLSFQKYIYTQRTTYCLILFIYNAQKRQICRDRQQIRSCLGLGELKELGMTANGHRGDKNALKLIGVIV